MKFKKDEIVKLLNLDIDDILGTGSKIEEVSYEDYKKLVDKYASKNGNDLFKKGKELFDDKTVDDALSIPFFLKAADEEVADAYHYLTLAYAYGYGVEENINKAINFALEGTRYEETYSCFFIGNIFIEGKYVAKDEISGIYYLEKAAERYFAPAHLMLGQYYRFDQAEPRDYKKAFNYFMNARNMGLSEGAYFIGEMYFYGIGAQQDYGESYNYLKEAADNNIYIANTLLGVLLRNGLGIKKNLEEAIQHLNIASENGDINATTELGDIYYFEEGFENHELAYKYYKKASDLNDRRGTLMLGVMYQLGNHVQKNYHEAYKLYQKSASQNYDIAFYNLGYLYEHGLGVKRDKKKAESFYIVSIKFGNQNAFTRLKELNSTYSGLSDINKEIYDYCKNYVEDIMKDAVSDLVSDAIDKIIDEDGNIISDIIGDTTAEFLFSCIDEQ